MGSREQWGHAGAGTHTHREGWVLGLGREPYTAGNWHQMLPDPLHPAGSWKHLFV